VCVDAATTSHFCGDILPLFLDGGNTGMGPFYFYFTPHCFLGDMPPSFLDSSNAQLIAGYYLLVCDVAAFSNTACF